MPIDFLVFKKLEEYYFLNPGGFVFKGTFSCIGDVVIEEKGAVICQVKNSFVKLIVVHCDIFFSVEHA